jgi:sulfatase-like protein
LRILIQTLLKLLAGAFFLLSSLYCLLGFLPYTYFAFVKAPPYAWLPWFVEHHVVLFWAALAVALAGYAPRRSQRALILSFGCLLALGAYLSFRPALAGAQHDWGTYAWSLAFLLPLLLLPAAEVLHSPAPAGRPDEVLFDYSTAMLVALMIGVTGAVGALLYARPETHPLERVEMVLFSLFCHLLVAALAFSALNLVFLGAARSARPRTRRRALVFLLAFAGLGFAVYRFLQGAVTFEGWPALLYAALLAAALIALAFSLVLPFLDRPRPAGSPLRGRVLAAAVLLLFLMLGAAAPGLWAETDWNGVVKSVVAVSLWLGIGTAVFRLRPRRARYSLAAVLAVALASGLLYEAARSTDIFWGRALGSTDDDIEHALETYSSGDGSFRLVRSVLGASRSEPCGDLCRILREYTNITGFQPQREIELVHPLLPATGPRPHIFILVIDALRPDYLGAYNPRVDFTPNLDALARDSTVVHNVYTQYAGTTLSEPALWAGALLLHDHDLRYFDRLNSLEKLAQVDGYKMVVSYDEVLDQFLAASNAITLDTDKKLWNQLDICDTVPQLESVLDSGATGGRPVFFYAQPKNVHQFARNQRPSAAADGWRTRDGFDNRIAHEVWQVDGCLGNFFAYLKQRGLYDNSLILVTSDHGDSAGEAGRHSHSLYIFPEVMRVPLLAHFPQSMRGKYVHDDSRVSTLTDIAPTLYYLLGHRPIVADPMYGQPIFVENLAELRQYPRDEIFLASDARAAYGLLADHGRYMYATYDSPAESYLFDLAADPKGERNIVTPALKRQYDERVIQSLHAIADFYGYKPGLESLLSGRRR